MIKFLSKFIAVIAVMTAVSAPAAQAGSRAIKLVNAAGDVVFDCGSINTYRTPGIIQPGVVMITKTRRQSATGNVADLSAKTRGYMKACEQGSEVIYVGHVAPILQIGIGVTKVVGGGDTVIHGSQALSGSSSGASAGASATASTR